MNDLQSKSENRLSYKIIAHFVLNGLKVYKKKQHAWLSNYPNLAPFNLKNPTMVTNWVSVLTFC